MRIGSHGFSSFLAILGGGLFLVLPVAFFSGAVSTILRFAAGPPCTFGVPSPTNRLCPIAIVPMPGGMVLNLIFLGVIGILLGFVALRLDPRPRMSFSVALALSLGLMAFLFETAISRTTESFSVKPVSVLTFPDLSILVMAGACAVFVYEFLRVRFSLPLKREDANACR